MTGRYEREKLSAEAFRDLVMKHLAELAHPRADLTDHGGYFIFGDDRGWGMTGSTATVHVWVNFEGTVEVNIGTSGNQRDLAKSMVASTNLEAANRMAAGVLAWASGLPEVESYKERTDRLAAARAERAAVLRQHLMDMAGFPLSGPGAYPAWVDDLVLVELLGIKGLRGQARDAMRPRNNDQTWSRFMLALPEGGGSVYRVYTDYPDRFVLPKELVKVEPHG